MNILIFEYEHMAIEDLCEALTNLGHTYTAVSYTHLTFIKLFESDDSGWIEEINKVITYDDISEFSDEL